MVKIQKKKIALTVLLLTGKIFILQTPTLQDKKVGGTIDTEEYKATIDESQQQQSNNPRWSWRGTLWVGGGSKPVIQLMPHCGPSCLWWKLQGARGDWGNVDGVVCTEVHGGGGMVDLGGRTWCSVEDGRTRSNP